MQVSTNAESIQQSAHKLAAARTRLMLERPFLGSLALHLRLEPCSWCRTTASDGQTFYYQPNYVDALPADQLQFVVAHIALHCALSHFTRRGYRSRQRWDMACDYAVNQLLVDDGLRPAADALLDVRFRALVAEEIYPLLSESNLGPTLDLHLDANAPAMGEPAEAGLGAMSQLNDAGANHERKQEASFSPTELEQRWRQRLIAAAHQARKVGRLGEVWRRDLGALALPQLSWRALLARFLARLARDDFSFQRLSRRSDDVLLPSLSRPSLRVAVAIDTSGSIGEEELREFVAELNALKAQLRAQVIAHACDDKLAANGPWQFEQWDALELPPEIGGGGGTRFTPVFDWLRDAAINPDCLLYFTDAMGEFPREEPAFPVLWLVKGNARVPWGERVQLND